MNWVVAGLLVFVFSVVMYLLVRRANFLGVPVVFQNLAMFIIPLGFYILLANFSHTSLAVTPYQLFILVITAIFFSYLGNLFSLKSIEYSPNPGYSLIISKSYVVFTTVASLFLFQAELTGRSILAILLIMIFSGFVMVGKPKTDQSHVRKSWLPLAITTFFCWGMLALLSKYLLDLGVPIYTRLIYVMAIVTGFICVEIALTKQKITRLSISSFMTLFLIGILGTGFNYFIQLGYQLAPNIGYINAINAASIAGITLLSAIWFKDELTSRKFLGIIGVIVGLILLVW